MTHDNKHINDLDAFSEAVRSKLDKHETPLDANLWDAIQAAIEPKKRQNLPLWWWITSGSAAAAVILMFVLFQSNPVLEPVTISKNDMNKSVNQKQEALAMSQETVSPKTTPSREKKSLPNSVFTKSVNAHTVNITQTESSFITGNNTSGILGNRTSEDKISMQTDSSQQALGKGTYPILSLYGLSNQPNNGNLGNKQLQKKQAKTLDKATKKNEWVLAISSGNQNNIESERFYTPSSVSLVTNATVITRVINRPPSRGITPPSNGPIYGITSSVPISVPIYGIMAFNPTNNSVLPKDTVTDVIKTNLKIITPAKITNINYWMPISFGLKVRKETHKRLVLESGLTYTFLHTDFIYTEIEQTRSSLSLHYLGIPLNLNLILWDNPHWEVYVSGGGTIEKGVSSVYREAENNANNYDGLVDKSAVEGMQLSINSAAGISYKIQPELAVYFEPQYSYYFDNNQPLSIRTKEPMVFNLHVGVRYGFKVSDKK